MTSFPLDALDNLFAAASGPVLHWDIRATVAEDIRSELHDPVLNAFCNLCRMTADKILHFDPLHFSAPGSCVDLRRMTADETLHFDPLRSSALGSRVVVPDFFDYSSSEDSYDERGSQHVRASPKFFYTIGEYETSSFYCNFLSDEVMHAFNGRMATVR